MPSIHSVAADQDWLTILARPQGMFQPHWAELLATPVEFSHKLSKSAGYAHLQGRRGWISLHAGFLRGGLDGEFQNTFFHEVAHVLAGLAYGPSAMTHGYHWGHCMLCFGFEPTKYHTIGRELSRAKATATLSLEDL